MKACVADSTDISGVIATLVEAFYSDPVWGWAFPRSISPQGATRSVS